MASNRRTRLEFGSTSTITEIRHLVRLIEQSTDTGDIADRYTPELIALLRPALNTYTETHG